MPMKKMQKLARSFLLEFVMYAVFVTGYFFLVMHFLGAWMKPLFDSNKLLYAFTALALMVAQGFLLEFATRWLLALVRKKTE